MKWNNLVYAMCIIIFMQIVLPSVHAADFGYDDPNLPRIDPPSRPIVGGNSSFNQSFGDGQWIRGDGGNDGLSANNIISAILNFPLSISLGSASDTLTNLLFLGDGENGTLSWSADDSSFNFDKNASIQGSQVCTEDNGLCLGGSNGVATDGTGSLNLLTYWLNSTTVAADSGVIIQPSTNGLSFNVLNAIQDIFIDDTQGYVEWNQVVKDSGFNTFKFQQEAWLPDFDTISQNTNNNNFLYKLQDEIYCVGLNGYIGSQTGWNATQTIGGVTSLLSDDDIRELFCHTGGDWETETQAFNITVEGTSTLPVRSDKEWWIGVSFRNSPSTSLPDNLIMEYKNLTGDWTVLVDTTPTAGQAHYIKQFDSSPSPNHILGLRWQFGAPQSSNIFLDELYLLHGAAWAEEFGKRGFDNVWHGTNTFLTNITMASPDGNLWTCGVDNSGSFSCS